QEYDASGISPLDGENVSVGGIVTLPPGYIVPGDPPGHTSMYIQSGGCGINVFCFDEPAVVSVALGDSVWVTGQVEEYISSSSGAGAVTEISCDTAADIEVITTGNPQPAPLELALSANMITEDIEGVLVRTVGIITVHQGFKMELDGLDDPVIYQGYNDSVNFDYFSVGDTLDVMGFVMQYDTSSPYLSGYEIVPRFQSDMAHFEAMPLPFIGFSSDVRLSFTEIVDVDTTGVVAHPVLGDEKAPVFYPDIGEVLPIYYKAPQESATVLTVYDLQGRIVRTLMSDDYDGYSDMPVLYDRLFPYRIGVRGWDGRDDLLRLVPAGTYICRLEAIDGSEVLVATAPMVVGARLK
ncbi:hypothetical protein K8S17_04635, partial [bacterium]|nr:hypothetical protein [bacterium]